MTKTEFIEKVRGMDRPVLRFSGGNDWFCLYLRPVWDKPHEIPIASIFNPRPTYVVHFDAGFKRNRKFFQRVEAIEKKYRRWFEEAMEGK